jgi:hypothetical protein
MGIDFSVNMLWVCDCGVCLVFMWVCRLMENTSSSGGFGTSIPDDNAPLWAYVMDVSYYLYLFLSLHIFKNICIIIYKNI